MDKGNGYSCKKGTGSAGQKSTLPNRGTPGLGNRIGEPGNSKEDGKTRAYSKRGK